MQHLGLQRLSSGKIYISNGKTTTAKVFVGHDSVSAIFNSLELAQIAEEKDGSIRVCHIQANKVVAAGYLQGSTKSINEENWTENLNALPRLNKLDVEVVVRNIYDPTEDTNKSGSKNKNKSFAAHVLCAEDNEEAVNLAL